MHIPCRQDCGSFSHKIAKRINKVASAVLVLIVCLLLSACAPKATPASSTFTPALFPTTAETPTHPVETPAAGESAPAVTPSAVQAVILPSPTLAPATRTPLPAFTPTEVSPLVLTLVAPTVTSGGKITASPVAPTNLTYQTIFHDTFDDTAKGWLLGEGMEIKDGALRMWTGARDINAIVAPLAEHTQADVSVKADVQLIRWDGASSLMFGAGCRMNESSYDQYMAFVGPLGKDKAMLQMVKFKGGKLAQMTDLPQIFNLPHSIVDEPVSFEFICQGQNLTFKVGTETVTSLTDVEFTTGSVDLFIMAADKQAAVAFDQVVVSQVREGK